MTNIARILQIVQFCHQDAIFKTNKRLPWKASIETKINKIQTEEALMEQTKTREGISKQDKI